MERQGFLQHVDRIIEVPLLLVNPFVKPLQSFDNLIGLILNLNCMPQLQDMLGVTFGLLLYRSDRLIEVRLVGIVLLDIQHKLLHL